MAEGISFLSIPCLTIFILLIFANFSTASKIHVPAKTYTCNQSTGGCQLNDPFNSPPGISQGACLATCGKGNLWPYPTGSVSIGQSVNYFEDIQFASASSTVSKAWKTEKHNEEEDGDEYSHKNRKEEKKAEKASANLLEAVKSNFLEEIEILKGRNNHKNGKEKKEKHTSGSNKDNLRHSNNPITLVITSQISDSSVVVASPDNDESYLLKIQWASSSNNIQVLIQSQTIFGYRHGLETLSQFCFWDDLTQSLGVASQVLVEDKPAFPYRGIMIDVSRHFISLNKLKENVRALGYNKMNVLHLHVSDTASFPLTIPSQPNMTAYGAYDDEMIFSTLDITELVDLANSYGVMILPEIDAPAHMGMGWQWGPSAGLGNLVVCDDPTGNGGTQWNSDAYEPPSGQLNLANENSFRILQNIYQDLIQQIPSPYFHLGGDEVVVGSDETWASCYNNTQLGAEIIAYVESLGLSRDDSSAFYQLWENFTIRATQMVQNIYTTNKLPLQKIHLWGGGGVDDSGVCYNLLAQDNLESFAPSSLFTIQVWDESSGSIVPDLIN